MVNIYENIHKVNNLCDFRVERKRRTTAIEIAGCAKEKPKK